MTGLTNPPSSPAGVGMKLWSYTEWGYFLSTSLFLFLVLSDRVVFEHLHCISGGYLIPFILVSFIPRSNY